MEKMSNPIKNEKKISHYIDKITEEIIPNMDSEDSIKVYDASKKAIDFFFKHIL